MAGSQDDIPPPPPPPSQTPTQQTPHTVSTIKLPILKKGEYDIWAMKMEHYLAHTDYPIWEVIQNGNGPVSITTDTQGQIKVLPPRTAEEILARERERKARTTLLMALPEDHLAKFHKMTDAKEMWDAIKSRFGGNDESKKMQKYILKQQFEGFSVSNSEGLHKGYDRFQSLLSQLEIHGAGVSTEDANQKFLRSLPSAWSQVSLIMRTKPGVDSLSFDDLYNNLRVFENDVKGSTASSSSTQNVAFVSENTSSTNDVSTAYGVSNPSGQNSQYEHASSYSLLANQSSCPQLDHEDLEQLDEFDLEEMDLKWQTGHFAKECRSKGNQDSRRRDAWNSGNKDGRRSGKQEDSKALVTIDGEGVDWTSHSEEEEDYDRGNFLFKRMLGYGDFRSDGILSYENEVLQSVFMNKESDLENQPLYERIVTAEDSEDEHVSLPTEETVSAVGGERETAVKLLAGRTCCNSKIQKLGFFRFALWKKAIEQNDYRNMKDERGVMVPVLGCYYWDDQPDLYEIIDFLLARSSNSITATITCDFGGIKEVSHPVIESPFRGRKSAKAKPSVHKDPAFDELGDDEIDYMED
ncbi:hypothetical protein Tco_1352146 [Tanacetum coccineum]